MNPSDHLLKSLIITSAVLEILRLIPRVYGSRNFDEQCFRLLDLGLSYVSVSRSKVAFSVNLDVKLIPLPDPICQLMQLFCCHLLTQSSLERKVTWCWMWLQWQPRGAGWWRSRSRWHRRRKAGGYERKRRRLEELSRACWSASFGFLYCWRNTRHG